MPPGGGTLVPHRGGAQCNRNSLIPSAGGMQPRIAMCWLQPRRLRRPIPCSNVRRQCTVVPLHLTAQLEPILATRPGRWSLHQLMSALSLSHTVVFPYYYGFLAVLNLVLRSWTIRIGMQQLEDPDRIRQRSHLSTAESRAE